MFKGLGSTQQSSTISKNMANQDLNVLTEANPLSSSIRTISDANATKDVIKVPPQTEMSKYEATKRVGKVRYSRPKLVKVDNR